ncbi:MAG: alpha/beta hydrolase-fold protein [Myxococcota bacterium]
MQALLTLWFAQAFPLMLSGSADVLAAAPRATPTAVGHWTDAVTVSGVIDGVEAKAKMLVYLPAGYDEHAATRYPLVLALPGWNHSPELFRDKGGLAAEADRHQVVIAVPAMGKSIYETALYPETKGTGLGAPGARWVGEVVLPYLRAHYAVRQDRAHTAVIGYSTGGRGAVFLAERYPEFAFAGSLSGTFDLMTLAPSEGEYKIHKVVYGARKKFMPRWVADNIVTPANLAALTTTRLFIGHGAADASVHPDQLESLRQAMQRSGLHFDVTFALVPGAIHDWAYWTSQWDAVFAAMDEAFAAGAQ